MALYHVSADVISQGQGAKGFATSLLRLDQDHAPQPTQALACAVLRLDGVLLRHAQAASGRGGATTTRTFLMKGPLMPLMQRLPLRHLVGAAVLAGVLVLSTGPVWANDGGDMPWNGPLDRLSANLS